ncbi:MAG: DUF4157 domain-containing protein [Acidimicrobiia bacterium]
MPRPRIRRLTPEARAAFAHVPPVDVERVRLIVVPVLTPGIVAMTVGRFVFLRRGHEADVGLVAHELVHVQQWRELGAFRFLVRYLGAYVRGRARGLGHWDAYRAIPFEAEARTRSAH